MSEVLQILDPCCGSRMFWFDKKDDRVTFTDIRNEEHTLCDGRRLEVLPDFIADFRELPFPDDSYQVVVFDPPHLVKAGKNGWQEKKYGILSDNWKDDLSKGFQECFRVLKTHGVLVFKWNETQIKVSEILELTDQKPLVGHKSGKRSLTHWILFIKEQKGSGE